MTKIASQYNFLNNKLINIGDGVDPKDAINKSQLDSVVDLINTGSVGNSINIIEVKGATTANITLSGIPSTIDGVTYADGDLILVKDQTTASQNGVYTITAGSWARASSYSTVSDFNKKRILVLNGTVNANLLFASFFGGGSATIGTTDMLIRNTDRIGTSSIAGIVMPSSANFSTNSTTGLFNISTNSTTAGVSPQNLRCLSSGEFNDSEWSIPIKAGNSIQFTKINQNISTTPMYLRMVGTGSTGAKPTWTQLTTSDIFFPNSTGTLVSTSSGTNIDVKLINSNISGLPFPLIWHDLAKYRSDTLQERFDGTSWTSATLNGGLLSDQTSAVDTVVNSTTILGTRFTFQWGSLNFNSAEWIMVAFSYTLPSPDISLIYETSTDGGVNYNTIVTKSLTGNDYRSVPIWIKIPNVGSENRMRLSFIYTSGTGDCRITNIKILSERLDSQGLNNAWELPYSTDVSRNVSLFNKLTLPASTSTQAMFRLTPGVTPSAFSDGDVWYTSSNNTISARISGVSRRFIFDNDLTSYYTKTETDTLLNGKENAITKATGYATWNGSAWVFRNETYSQVGHTHVASDITDFTTASNTVIDSRRGVANGIAPLDANNKIDAQYLPAIAIVDTFVVNSQAAMLALSAQQGDVAVRSDINKTFILTNNTPGTLGSWQELLTPGSGVTSVNGQTGVVTLTTDNITQGSTNLYFSNTLARSAISLTTTGSSGASTYNSSTGVLNVPNYTLSGLGGVATSRTLQFSQGDGIVINNTTALDLTANRSWTISANLTTSGGDNGIATTVARGDHTHDSRYLRSDITSKTLVTLSSGQWVANLYDNRFTSSTSVSAPESTNGYWTILGRRDVSGGYAGLWLGQGGSNNVYFGIGSTNTDNPTWIRLARASELASYQPLDADLTAIAALSGTTGLLRKIAADTWSLDTNTYATTTELGDYVLKAGDTMSGALTISNNTGGNMLFLNAGTSNPAQIRFKGNSNTSGWRFGTSSAANGNIIIQNDDTSTTTLQVDKATNNATFSNRVTAGALTSNGDLSVTTTSVFNGNNTHQHASDIRSIYTINSVQTGQLQAVANNFRVVALAGSNLDFFTNGASRGFISNATNEWTFNSIANFATSAVFNGANTHQHASDARSTYRVNSVNTGQLQAIAGTFRIQALDGNNLEFWSNSAARGSISNTTNQWTFSTQINGTAGVFSGNLTAAQFIRSGGLSTQFLKADGSVDSNSYATTTQLGSYLPLSGGILTGALTGTTATFSGTVSVANPTDDLHAINRGSADSRYRLTNGLMQNRLITMSGDLRNSVIPLVPLFVAGSSGTYGLSRVLGKLYITRGNTSSTNRLEVIEVSAQTAYLSSTASINSLFGLNAWSWRLVTFLRGGISWIGLTNTISNVQSGISLSFEGIAEISTTVPVGITAPNISDQLTVINYFNTQTSAVLDAEINGSIAEYNSPAIYRSEGVIRSSRSPDTGFSEHYQFHRGNNTGTYGALGTKGTANAVTDIYLRINNTELFDISVSDATFTVPINGTSGNFTGNFIVNSSYGTGDLIVRRQTTGTLFVVSPSTNQIQLYGDIYSPNVATAAADGLYGYNSSNVMVKASSATLTGNLTAAQFIRSGGLSTQFLKADGSIDSNTYATTTQLSAYLPLAGGTMSGAINMGGFDVFNIGLARFNNNVSAFITTQTQPILYSSNASGTGSFSEAGNLIISPRISGAARDVIISTLGTKADLTVDRSGNTLLLGNLNIGDAVSYANMPTTTWQMRLGTNSSGAVDDTRPVRWTNRVSGTNASGYVLRWFSESRSGASLGSEVERMALTNGSLTISPNSAQGLILNSSISGSQIKVTSLDNTLGWRFGISADAAGDYIIVNDSPSTTVPFRILKSNNNASFLGTVSGSDAVNNNEFITLGQANTAYSTSSHTHTVSWTGGTTAGPTLSVQGITAVIPSASNTASGVITTDTQTITGVKTFASNVQLQSNLLINNPADTFAYTIIPSAITAARNLTLPLITGNDTLAVLGLSQTFTGVQTARGWGITRQAFTPTGTTQAITLTTGNLLDLILTSSTGNVTVTLSAASAGAESILQVTGHASAARNVLITQASTVIQYNGSVSAAGATVDLGTTPIGGRSTYRLVWITATYVVIHRVSDNIGTGFITNSGHNQITTSWSVGNANSWASATNGVQFDGTNTIIKGALSAPTTTLSGDLTINNGSASSSFALNRLTLTYDSVNDGSSISTKFGGVLRRTDTPNETIYHAPLFSTETVTDSSNALLVVNKTSGDARYLRRWELEPRLGCSLDMTNGFIFWLGTNVHISGGSESIAGNATFNFVDAFSDITLQIYAATGNSYVGDVRITQNASSPRDLHIERYNWSGSLSAFNITEFSIVQNSSSLSGGSDQFSIGIRYDGPTRVAQFKVFVVYNSLPRSTQSLINRIYANPGSTPGVNTFFPIRANYGNNFYTTTSGVILSSGFNGSGGLAASLNSIYLHRTEKTVTLSFVLPVANTTTVNSYSCMTLASSVGATLVRPKFTVAASVSNDGVFDAVNNSTKYSAIMNSNGLITVYRYESTSGGSVANLVFTFTYSIDGDPG